MPAEIQPPHHKVEAALFVIKPENTIGLISLRTACPTFPGGLLFSTALPFPVHVDSEEEARDIFLQAIKHSKSEGWEIFYYGEPNEG